MRSFRLETLKRLAKQAITWAQKWMRDREDDDDDGDDVDDDGDDDDDEDDEDDDDVDPPRPPNRDRLWKTRANHNRQINYPIWTCAWKLYARYEEYAQVRERQVLEKHR